MSEQFELGDTTVFVATANFLKPHVYERGGGSVGQIDIGIALGVSEINDITVSTVIEGLECYVFDPKIDLLKTAAAIKVPLEFSLISYNSYQTNIGYIEVEVDRENGFRLANVYLPKTDDAPTRRQAIEVLLKLAEAKAIIQEKRGNKDGIAQAQQIREYLKKPELLDNLVAATVKREATTEGLSSVTSRQREFESVVWKDTDTRAYLGLSDQEYPTRERFNGFLAAAVDRFVETGLDRAVIKAEAIRRADGRHEEIIGIENAITERAAWSMYKGIEWILEQPDVPDEMKQRLITERFVPDALGMNEGVTHIASALQSEAQIALIRSPVIWKTMIYRWAEEAAPEIFAQTIERVLEDKDVHNIDSKTEFLETILRDTTWRPPERVLSYLLFVYENGGVYKRLPQFLSRAFASYVHNRVLEMGDTFEIARALETIGIFRDKSETTSKQKRGEQVITQITLMATRFPIDADPRGNWALFAKSWNSFVIEEYKAYVSEDVLGLLVTAPENVISLKDRQKAAFAITDYYFTPIHVQIKGILKKPQEAVIPHITNQSWRKFSEIIRAIENPDTRNIVVQTAIRTFLEYKDALEKVVLKVNRRKKSSLLHQKEVNDLDFYIKILEAVKIGDLSPLDLSVVNKATKSEKPLRFNGRDSPEQ